MPHCSICSRFRVAAPGATNLARMPKNGCVASPCLLKNVSRQVHETTPQVQALGRHTASYPQHLAVAQLATTASRPSPRPRREFRSKSSRTYVAPLTDPGPPRASRRLVELHATVSRMVCWLYSRCTSSGVRYVNIRCWSALAVAAGAVPSGQLQTDAGRTPSCQKLPRDGRSPGCVANHTPPQELVIVLGR